MSADFSNPMTNLMTNSMSQIDRNHQLRHLLSIKGLGRSLVLRILDKASEFLINGEIQKSPCLKGVLVANLFFEPSTRTRVTFEIAEKSLQASTLSLNIEHSSTRKGESIIDTIKNLEQMGVKMFVVRHPSNGSAHFFRHHLSIGNAVINAGDGSHSHPTQALLDMATLRQYRHDFDQLRVLIIGDLLHSRVARSQIEILKTLGVTDIRAVAPLTLYSSHLQGVQYFSDLRSALSGVDVIFSLRLQEERMAKALIPSRKEFFELYGLTPSKLKGAKSDVLVFHPGPVNRGVELDSQVVDGKHSVIFNQVTHGIAIRMAVMSLIKQGMDAALNDSNSIKPLL